MIYRPELDGIRAIAVGAVILAHAGAPLPGGHLGVDIFFVLSGFLITGQILRDLASDRFSLGQFYARRARRILPALTVVALACLPLAWILLPPERMEQFGQGLVALTVFASNVLFWQQSGYFAPAAAENPLIHTWSLAVEEQFYLVFPLLLVLLWRRARARIGWILLAICLVSLAAFAEAWGRDLDSAFYLLPFRIWELMAGALTAWVCRNQAPWSDGKLAALGLLLIAVALALGAANPVQGWVWSLMATVGTVLLLIYVRPKNWVGQLLSLSPLCGLGLISYSAYLWHQPVLAFARLGQIEPLSPLQLTGLVGVTLLLAWATWAWIERPFRHMPPARVPGFILAGGTGVGFACVGMVADLSGGLGSQRFTPQQLQLFATAVASPERDNCHGSVVRFRVCVYGAKTPPTLAVIGDSHAVEIAYELGKAKALQGDAVLHISASACPPQLDQQQPCGAWMAEALARVALEPVIDTIVLVWRHSLYAPKPTAGPAEHSAYWTPVRQIIARLQAQGHKVVLLAPVPELPRHVDVLVRDNRHEGLSRSDHERRQAALSTDIDKLPVRSLDPASFLCDAKWCYATRGDQALYFDDDHLSLAGARLTIAPLIAEFSVPDLEPILVGGSTR